MQPVDDDIEESMLTLLTTTVVRFAIAGLSWIVVVAVVLLRRHVAPQEGTVRFRSMTSIAMSVVLWRVIALLWKTRADTWMGIPAGYGIVVIGNLLWHMSRQRFHQDLDRKINPIRNADLGTLVRLAWVRRLLGEGRDQHNRRRARWTTSASSERRVG